MGNTDKSANAVFAPKLGLWDATMIVAGSMIGSGIFIVSADIERNMGGAGWLIAVWVLTGLMTLTAALSYGELSGMYPKAGGQYVYLQEAYSPVVGFLYGWSLFTVIQTGTIAAVGVAFSKFAAYLYKDLSEDNKIFSFQTGLDACGHPTFYSISAAQTMALFVIILLTYTNTRGVKGAKWIQNIFTSAKLIALFGLIIAGFFAFNSNIWSLNWQHAWDAFKTVPLDTCNLKAGFQTIPLIGATLFGGFASAMVGSVFSSDAWNNVTFIAGEIKNPSKNVGLSLFLGTLIVTVIYVCANLVYISVLPLDKLAHVEKDRVAVAAANVIFGKAGTIIMAILIMVSTFGCNNGLILSGARVYRAMANDNLFFKQAKTLNNKEVPAWGLWLQCLVCCLLCLSGKYGDLLDMVSFVVVIFYVMTIAGIFILRKKQPDTPRPYKAFGYPILPVLYIIMGLSFCGLLIIYKPSFTWPGLLIALSGIPVYFIMKASQKT